MLTATSSLPPVAGHAAYSTTWSREGSAATTTVLLPAYNEEHGLDIVLGRLLPLLDTSYEVLVVDDGSVDRTSEVAQAYGCQLVRHPVNRGKGAAMRSGFMRARGGRLIVVDADDTYPVDAVPVIAEALEHYDFVLGRRVGGRFNISPMNRVGNAVFQRAISMAAGCTVRDPLTGLYGLQRHLVDRLELTSSGFGIEAEIVIKAGRMGARTLEIPIGYRPRIGQSKLHAVRDGFVIGRTIVSAAMSSPVLATNTAGQESWIAGS